MPGTFSSIRPKLVSGSGGSTSLLVITPFERLFVQTDSLNGGSA